MYKSFLKPILFQLDPEKAHTLTMWLYKMALAIPGAGIINDKFFLIEKPELEKKVFGLTFKNSIGLAAGFDKNAEYIPLMARLGFGHIEVGTVTPLPQPGNDKPRLFRLPKDEALINRMGFNNNGVDAIVKNLGHAKTQRIKEEYKIIIGGNIGKNKNTDMKIAWVDYLQCFDKLFEHVDYFVVNVSSPNTPGLRELQEKQPLNELLNRLQEMNQEKNAPKPLLLKIAPELTDEQLNDIAEIVIENKFSGIVATNTTVLKNNLMTPDTIINKIGAGGVSGAPLRNRSTEVIAYLKKITAGLSENKISLPTTHYSIPFEIIGVGGINNVADVKEKINAGASLVQLYTGLIYEGPGVVKKINSQFENLKI